MSLATRETVAAALKAKIDTLVPGTFKSSSRVWKMPSQVDSQRQPVIYVVEPTEGSVIESGTPTLRTWNYDLIIYANSGKGKNSIPVAALNPLLDALDTLFEPDAVSGFQDLGGVVQHAWISGATEKYEGHEEGQAVGIVPIQVMPKGDNAPGQSQFVFDVGYLFGTPNARPDGSATNQTPVRFGALKGIVLDIATDLAYPSTQLESRVLAAVAGRTYSCTARLGVINGYLLNQIYFGRELETGSTLMSFGNEVAIPGSPYQVTPTPPGGGTFQEDLGVVWKATGLALKKVTGTPATGEYAESSGTYTFAVADTGTDVAYSYLYSLTSGTKLTMQNREKWLSPTFRAVLQGSYNGKQMTVVLNECAATRFAYPAIIEQFAIMDFEFEAVSDSTGVVGTIGTA